MAAILRTTAGYAVGRALPAIRTPERYLPVSKALLRRLPSPFDNLDPDC